MSTLSSAITFCTWIEKVMLKTLGKFQSDSHENVTTHLARKFRHNFIKSATNGRACKTLISDIK